MQTTEQHQGLSGDLRDGIWQFARSVPVNTPEGTHITNHYTFILDHGAVILRLMSLSPTFKHSANELYRLRAKWDGNMLYYLPPFSDRWEELAKFNGDRFISEGDGKRWEYTKIAPSAIADWNKDMVSDIPMFAYST